MSWVTLRHGLRINTDHLVWVLTTTLWESPAGQLFSALEDASGYDTVDGLIAVTADGERHKLAGDEMAALLAAIGDPPGPAGVRTGARDRDGETGVAAGDEAKGRRAPGGRALRAGA